MEKAIVLFLLFVISSGYCKQYTPVLQCGPDKLFKNVAITSKAGLCTKLPCQFKLGETLQVEIEFQNKNRVEKILSKCNAKVLGSNIEFPIPDAEKGCDYLVNAKCPVKPNTDLEMKINVPVRPPSLLSKIGIDVKLQFSLHDQTNNMISCFQVNAKVDV